jgi:photosystem II stability/assembly factor-like uncharacterized protein
VGLTFEQFLHWRCLLKTLRFIFFGLIFLLTACNTPTTSITAQAPVSNPPTPFPDTPAPAGINAAIVDAPTIIGIQMLNEMDGWAVTETQIVRTNDGGVTWYNVTPRELSELGYGATSTFLDRGHAFILITDSADPINAGVLYHTSDGGLTWTSNPVPFGWGDLRFLDPSNGWVMVDLGAGAGSMGVAIFQTTDGGETWTQTYTNDPNLPNAADSLPLGGLKNNLRPINMQTAWVGGVTYASGFVYLYRTDDGGKNWSLVSVPLPDDAQNFEFNVDDLQFVTTTDAFLVVRLNGASTQQAIYVTHNGGETWLQTPMLIPQGGSADFSSTTDGVIYNGDQFYVTRDAAQTWTSTKPNIVFGDSFSSMDFINSSTGWVITTDASNHHSLYGTSDGGTAWFSLVP